MSNNKQSSVIDQAISQIEEKIIQSRTDDVTTRRSGDYRIGLNEAKNILENLREIHKQEIVNAVDGFPIHTRHLNGEEYYNETYANTNSN